MILNWTSDVLQDPACFGIAIRERITKYLLFWHEFGINSLKFNIR